jgi:hypothetical protein
MDSPVTTPSTSELLVGRMKSEATNSTDKSLPAEERLELANRLFREYYAACFWHLKPDLRITEEMMPIVVKGLRSHGGRAGALAAARLLD